MLGREEWDELLAGYMESGLTQAAYCKREGINYHTFVAWLGRQRRSGSKDGQPGRTKFHEITIPSVSGGSDAGLEVFLPDGTVLRGGDADALARLSLLLRG